MKESRGLPVAAACAVLFFALAISGAPAIRQIVPRHVPAVVARLQSHARLPGSNRLNLTIGLPLRNQSALAELLQQLYDPANTNYHRYLTPAQFADRFGPDQQDYSAVIAFAQAHGLTVRATHPNRTLLEVSGSATAVENAFHLTLHYYQHPTEPRQFYAPDVEPSLDLAVPILSIDGLDNFTLPRPMSLRTNAFARFPDAVTYSTGSGPGGNFIGRDFRAAYAPGLPLNGSGQSVGLFELDGYYASDILTYKSLAGLPDVPLTNVLVDAFGGQPGGNNLEVALDIDMAMCMAPGLSRILVYEGTTPNDVLNRMATDNLAKQLSCSWGFGNPVDPVRDQIFQQFAAQGQSMFQASGDDGAWVGGVFPPSDNPYLTVVGGTSVTTAGLGGAWLSETTWPYSGGGISTVYPIPLWQQGLSMSANLGSTTMRNIPDVACQADDNIWVVADNGQQGVVAGTSAAAPLWAGFMALANQQAAASHQPSVGFVNPALYALGQSLAYPAALHDITTGNNTNSASSNLFFAVTGYDLCTGWGSPAGSNLISALLSPLDALQISPATGLAASGPVGGPFSPSSQSYTLTNFGSAPLNWALLNTSLWLTASITNGALAPGGPATTVTVALNAAASNLPAGGYATTLWFSNSNDHFAQSRLVSLAVVTVPVITSQPTNQTLLPGATATFSVQTSSNALLCYQWRLDNGAYLTNLTDGGNVSGSATSTLTVSNVASANVGTYSVIITNAAGMATSSVAYLALVPWRPVITSGPASQTALPGQTITLSVATLGSQPLFYQWQESGTNLVDGGNLSGSATSALTFSNVTTANAGSYAVIVSNSLGSAVSTGAVLTVVSVTAPSVSLTPLYSFTGASDGGNPNGLILGADGNFYGTTRTGGTNSAGTIFRLATNGSPVDLYSFSGGNDGAFPTAGVVQGTDGNLYGTTPAGGTNGFGTVFRSTTNGVLVSLVAFNFDGTNGITPFSGVIQGGDQNFYGTAYEGGSYVYGAVFRMSSNGAMKTIYSFTDGGDGGFPYAPLSLGHDGALYGTTYSGGAHIYYGTVFKTTTNGALTTLASFAGATNGAFPYAGLVQGDDGTFYGNTSSSGNHGYGTVFDITPGGSLTNLYSFGGGADGSRPLAGLMQGSDGNFYGSTANGGNFGAGTIFRLAPGGALTTLVQFDGYNGANPAAALTQGADGNLYGVTPNGGANGQGVIFRLSVTAAPQITAQPADQTAFQGATVAFDVAVFGSAPLFYQWQANGANLTNGGNISGSTSRILTITNVTTGNAGIYSVIVSNALGSVLSANASLEIIVSPAFITGQPTNLTVAPGANASFSVTAIGDQPLSYQWRANGTNLTDAGNVSGSATSVLSFDSVTEANNGTYTVVVSNALDSVTSNPAMLLVVPPSATGTLVSTLFSFSGGTNGGNPSALALGVDGNLYGTTEFGGASPGYGSAFRVTTNAQVTTFAVFQTNSGNGPDAELALGADGNFYGTTAFGGTNSVGNIFRLATNGALANIYSFTGGTDGSSPATVLAQGAGGDFYGTTISGGNHGLGNIFELAPGGVFSNVYSFTGLSDGQSPIGQLTPGTDGDFYGVTAGGGAHGYGTVFKATPFGALTTLYSFTGGTDGSGPNALVLGSDGNFYGTTASNTIRGLAFYGTVFRIAPSGAFATLYSLNPLFGDGAYPYAGLIQGTDGNFYGTTSQGGLNGDGTVFSIAPNAAFSTLLSFDGFDDGANPVTPLVEGLNGSLYGTTSTGGPGGSGTVFELAFTAAPQITTPPAGVTVLAGAAVAFSVAVFGAPPLSYQWQENGTNLTDGFDLAGSGSRILTLTNVSFASDGTYSVIVSNALGSVTSPGANLTVVVAPRFQAAIPSNGILTLTWTVMPGETYQLQYRSVLPSGRWNNLGSAVPATNGTMIATDTIGSNAQRYYRVVLLP